MRVIAGDAKGTRLEAPKGQETRPTLDRVREALFSILGAKVAEARVLDLYAGTGAIGIEALSRGAGYCEFVENDAQCAALVRRNVEVARVGPHAKVRRLRLPEEISKIGRGSEGFDLIYADPPFNFEEYALICDELMRFNLLNPDGILIVEHDSRSSLANCSRELTCFREARYGATCLSFFSARQGETDTQ